MNKHSVTLPDGTVATRNSKSRTYTHAIVVREGSEWGAFSWAGSLKLAQARLVEARDYTYDECRIATVEVAA